MAVMVFQQWGHSQEGSLQFAVEGGDIGLGITGTEDQLWILESSTDLVNWTVEEELGILVSNDDILLLPQTALASGIRFYRATPYFEEEVDFLFDPLVLRVIELSFEESNWQTLLANNYSTATELAGDLSMDGIDYLDVGIRYKGNTSYTRSGEKKSIAVEMDFTDPELDLLGYETLNFNNAYEDETILREALYFNVLSEFTISPKAGFAQIWINGENWGVYTNSQQQDGDLIREWFDDNDGDRWKSPSGTGAGDSDAVDNGGGGPGGGGFASGVRALSYLGEDPATYQAEYELKSENTDDPWGHLINATRVLANTPAETLRDEIETVLAVDSWLWFLAGENLFTDGDAYWSKGRDYQFYYDPEGGRIHPIEHDGNEAFNVTNATLDPMSDEDNANRPVITKFLSNAELRQRYLAHYRVLLEERFHPDYLFPLIDAYRAIIDSAVQSDSKKGYDYDAFESDIASLKSHIESRYQYLSSHSEISQIAPMIDSVSDPGSPVVGETITITADVAEHESDGVDSVWLYHRGGDVGSYDKVEMLDDGLSGDGSAGDGVYGANVSGYLGGVKVRYYVEARSGNEAKSARFSPDKAESDPLDFRVAIEAAESTSVVINEFMASNDDTVADPQGEYDDWIELRNLSSTSVDLSGRYLSDDTDKPRKWQFPEGSTIPAGGYLIVWADEDGDAEEGLHANFKLSASGERILFVDTDASSNLLLDSVTFGSQETGISEGRSPLNTDLFVRMNPTPGEANE